jgi:MFS family permease
MSDYRSDDSGARISRISRLLFFASLGFFIVASLVNTLYALTGHHDLLFKTALVFIILSDVFYAIIVLSLYQTGKLQITDRLIFLSLGLFAIIFISEIILEVNAGTGLFPGIVGFVGLAFGFMYYYFKDDELLSRVMIIIAAILAYIAMAGYPLRPYIFTFGTSYLNSALWAQAFIIMEILLILAFLFKSTQIVEDFLAESAKSLGLFIFAIGMIITGASLASINFAGFPAALGDTLSAILIIAGIFALIAGILIVIISLMDFYNSVIKPRLHFMR